jgi:hypothetical protein
MNRTRALRFSAIAAALALPAFFFSYKAYRVGLFDGLLGPAAPGMEASPSFPSGQAAACGDCHGSIGDLHRRGPHRVLLCEACHGFQMLHRRDGVTPPETMVTSSVVRLCSRCHREIRESGEAGQRLNLEAHVVEVGALFSEGVCFDCHQPHDPRP